MIDSHPDYILWGPMDRRSIRICVFIKGSPLISLKKTLTAYVSLHENKKVLLYTNSKMAADGSIYELVDDVLEATKIKICLLYTSPSPRD